MYLAAKRCGIDCLLIHGFRHTKELKEYKKVRNKIHDIRGILKRWDGDTKVKEKAERITGVYWGRFNPIHKGHIAVIKKLRRRTETLIVVIGSSEHKDEEENPFSGAERANMVTAYLKEEGIEGCRVVTINDDENYANGVDNIFRKCGNVDLLFLSDEYRGVDKSSARDKIINAIAGRARIAYFSRRGKLSSTLLRGRIADSKTWENLTGKSVVRIIKGIDGIDRIRRSRLR